MFDLGSNLSNGGESTEDLDGDGLSAMIEYAIGSDDSDAGSGSSCSKERCATLGQFGLACAEGSAEFDRTGGFVLQRFFVFLVIEFECAVHDHRHVHC